MLDGVSLDQLRIFVAAADEGSFSAAARSLNRTQSAVSESIANLEAQLRVTIFDRTNRYPKLTPTGVVLLHDARAVVAGVDAMKARAKGISDGLEAELVAVFDVFFPLDALSDAAHAFYAEFPRTPLRISVEALGGVIEPVLDGRAGLALVASFPTPPQGLIVEDITRIDLITVAAPDHPLAAYPGPIPRTELARYVQLVLTDRSALSSGNDYNVVSPSTWRLADLFAKQAFILRGLGWGSMPSHAVEADIKAGRLVTLDLQEVPQARVTLPMLAVYKATTPPGPAGRWLIDYLKSCTRSEK
ncbi:LysR family transcriptional regulator [Gemmobacter aquarius]|uniref:LysR family transcriptional regulator n=1 Tax=Paragemmobacter aquarius TaxID=2169400 RepID=A0A2S0UNK2_9RHOB|nr:LysR family transcriptional regulator [Gemmobacter aquarius]AWB49372.1 LysR family transcriptional regulator [Gemmobacter aquarius]